MYLVGKKAWTKCMANQTIQGKNSSIPGFTVLMARLCSGLPRNTHVLLARHAIRNAWRSHMNVCVDGYPCSYSFQYVHKEKCRTVKLIFACHETAFSVTSNVTWSKLGKLQKELYFKTENAIRLKTCRKVFLINWLKVVPWDFGVWFLRRAICSIKVAYEILDTNSHFSV